MTDSEQPINLRDLDRPALEGLAVEWGQSAYRGRQLFTWLYRPGVREFAQMTDLSKSFRQELATLAIAPVPTPAKVERSADGTIKYGFRLEDGKIIESVMIPEPDRTTLCVSSQVGCAMGCQFCLTGQLKLKRNLTPAEIVGQVVAVRDSLAAEGRDLNNLVFMGMGEPLANFEALLTSIRILLDSAGPNFSSRKITVSTCGLIPQMEQLGAEVPVNIAISLHAVDDEIRSQLMPINRTYQVDALLAACRRYPLPRRRRITFEYILIRDINDSPPQARLLAKKLRGIHCKINLLPFNEAAGLPFRRSSDEAITRFQEILIAEQYTTTIRNSRGADISAACGQLAGSLT